MKFSIKNSLFFVFAFSLLAFGASRAFAQITQPVLMTGVSVSGASSVLVGGTLQMSVAVSPSNATNQTVTWSVAPGGTGVASISQNGLLTAAKAGTVTVVAAANDYSGASGSEQVTINPTSLTVTGISVSSVGSVAIGGTLQMSVAVSPSNATNQTVTWSVAPGGTGAAVINSNGLLTATAAGTVTAVATANDGSGVTGSEQVTINSTSVVTVGGISVTGGSSVTIGGTLQMSAAVSPSNATNQTVAWSVAPNDAGAAVISPSGLLTPTIIGTVIVTAAANDGSGVTGSEQVTINPATYTAPTYTLTYTAGAHGSITGTSPQALGQGATGTAVTAVPDAGYQFTAWSDGETANPRTDTDIQGSINVAANFSLVNAPASPSTGTDALRAEIAQLQAQLVVLLQELLTMLQSQATH